MLSFVSKTTNKLIEERDYSAQEVCHLLLGLPLQGDSRVVRSVDCRPLSEQSAVTLEFGEDEVSEKTFPIKRVSWARCRDSEACLFDMLSFPNLLGLLEVEFVGMAHFPV